MRIAFLLHQFPKLSETFILRQVTGMLDRKHDVTVLAEYADASGQEHDEVRRYRLMEHTKYISAPEQSGLQELSVWPLARRTWSPLTGRPSWNAIRVLKAIPQLGHCMVRQPKLTREVLSRKQYGYQAESFSSLYRLASLARGKSEYDVLHAHFGPVGQSFRFARELFQAPLVVSFHGYDFSTWPQRRGAGAYDRLFSDVDLVTAHTAFAEQRLLDLGCPAEKIRRLACGVNLDEFAFRPRHRGDDEATRILSVGRLVEKKGIEFGIRAVAALINRGYPIQYTVLGEGPLKPQLKRLAFELGIEHAVGFEGACSGTTVREWMDRSHLFLLPSITASDGDTEGAPVSIMEAQACGLPVVSTRHAGIPEILDDEASGFLVPESDVEALADCLGKLMDRPHDWPAIGKRGRAFIERSHDIRKLNVALEAIYDEAIKLFQANRAAPAGVPESADPDFPNAPC